MHDHNVVRVVPICSQLQFDLGMVYDEPEHCFIHKWLLLTDPTDPSGGATVRHSCIHTHTHACTRTHARAHTHTHTQTFTCTHSLCLYMYTCNRYRHSPLTPTPTRAYVHHHRLHVLYHPGLPEVQHQHHRSR